MSENWSFEQILFDQMAFIRKVTVNALKEVSEETARKIPDGFRNSLLWQAGHIYYVAENFAFGLHNLEGKQFQLYKEFFANRTSPADWIRQPPALAEVLQLLSEQPERIRQQWQGKMDVRLDKPFTTSTGYTMSTVGALLNYSLHHEGMHFQAIKMYKTMLSK